MKRLVATSYFMIALIGPSFAQSAPSAGKKVNPKQSSECRLVGAVKGTKIWAGNCISPETTAAPGPEPELEPKNAIRGGKE